MSNWSLLLCSLFLIPSLASAQLTYISPLALGPLGHVIDSTENARYHIFGDIKGLTAGRFYRVNHDTFHLHLLRNTKRGAQILILDLPVQTFWNLDEQLRNRIDQANKENPRFEHALYPIEKSQWTERSANKKVLLSGGSQLLVTLERAEQDTLIVETTKGLRIRLPDPHIVQVIDGPAGTAEQGRVIFSDPNNSRLFFAPTGRRLESGHVYLANYFIFFPTVAVGLTDYLSLSGGVSLIPGAESQLLYFAPKLTLSASSQVGLATGFLYLAMPESEDDFNLGYAVITVGDKQKSLTFGTGLPLSSNTDRNLVLMLGGEAKLSDRAKFISENWIITGDDVTAVFSGGIRFFGEKLAVDLALITSDEALGGSGFPFLPWVDFSVFFGD